MFWISQRNHKAVIIYRISNKSVNKSYNVGEKNIKIIFGTFTTLIKTTDVLQDK